MSGWVHGAVTRTFDAEGQPVSVRFGGPIVPKRCECGRVGEWPGRACRECVLAVTPRRAA